MKKDEQFMLINVSMIALVALVAIIGITSMILLNSGSSSLSASSLSASSENLGGDAIGRSECLIKSSLNMGETKVYSIKGIEYELTSLFVSIDGRAKIMANGEPSPALGVRESFTFNSGLKLTILSVNSKTGIVIFCLNMGTPSPWPYECTGMIDTFRLSETKTYTIDGTEYEITFAAVNGRNAGKVMANGELSDWIHEDGLYQYANGLTVGMEELLIKGNEGFAMLCVDPASSLPHGVLVLNGQESPFWIDVDQNLFIINHHGNHYTVVMSGGPSNYDAEWVLDGKSVRVHIDLDSGLVTFNFPRQQIISVITN